MPKLTDAHFVTLLAVCHLSEKEAAGVCDVGVGGKLRLVEGCEDAGRSWWRRLCIVIRDA